MNLSELTERVSQALGTPKGQTRNIIRTTFDAVQLEVSAGGRVCVVGFGSFYPVQRKQRLARNPQTGEEVTIEATVVPRFKPGKEFKDITVKGKKKASQRGSKKS